jgi:hypothetical protein
MTVFGVQTWIGPDPQKYAHRIYDIGCRETRVEVRWRDVEPVQVPYGTPGQYHWTTSLTDEYIRKCASASLRPVPILYLPPGWASNYRGVTTDLVAWGRFCYECVKRYGPGGTFWQENPSLPQYPITLYEIGNEPNFWTYEGNGTYPNGVPVWNGYPEEYVPIFNSAAGGIRARATELGQHIDVIIGGLGFREPGYETPGVWNPFNFLDVLQGNGISIPDAVGFHPYGWNLGPEYGAADSPASAYQNTNGRIKRMVNKLIQMGWSNVGLDITEDGIPSPPLHPQYPDVLGRYNYFRDTVTTIKNTYQTPSVPVRRYCAFAWSVDNSPDNFNIALDDSAYTLLDAGNGYRDGING